MSAILMKIAYYKKLADGLRIRAGWDARTKNADGDFPCVYMRMNEFGTRNIPPRPFMRTTAKKNRSKWKQMLILGLTSSMDPSKLGNLIGSRMRSDIQETIISNMPPPNAPSTIKAKAKHNVQGTLRDTLYAYQTVTYAVGRGDRDVAKSRV